ncbi:hypothetical protein SAMN02745171_00525 [Porphyromonas circumdentaria]|uniref:Uncharacterized protein n=1 Tax=Porphyromonas circumdentaria TaxID=29524 RepID=A0A1T4LTN7_9PORP|nr:hypothetical protein [Porphyromonas circumdentaria]SJZ57991.1 hypothetical protein SAMN02745171_00525 [Porphyromonas circumdentaria]
MLKYYILFPKGGDISVEENRYHILKDVVHLIVFALLCDCLASSFHI